jgi:hypothetical protein
VRHDRDPGLDFVVTDIINHYEIVWFCRPDEGGTTVIQLHLSFPDYASFFVLSGLQSDLCSLY